MNQGFLEPQTLLSLGRVQSLDRIEVDGELRLGAMATHRAVERSAAVQRGLACARASVSLVASPACATRPRSAACSPTPTTPRSTRRPGGARRPGAARSARGERTVGIEELIRGHHETCIAADELLVEVRVPPAPERAVYRSSASRSARTGPAWRSRPRAAANGLRVVVGAVAGRPRSCRPLRAAAGPRRSGGLRRRDRADERFAR